MASVINGRSPITGNIKGQWTQGLSAYSIAVQQGFQGTVTQWLESLKAYSPEIGEITETEGGITFTIKDENGEQTVFLSNGKDITIESSETNEDGETIIIFSDGSQITVPKGVQGPKGEDGREVTMLCDNQGIVYWKYDDESDSNWKQIIDLGSIASQQFASEFESHQLLMVVDELPEPQDAIPGIIYILREEV